MFLKKNQMTANTRIQIQEFPGIPWTREVPERRWLAFFLEPGIPGFRDRDPIRLPAGSTCNGPAGRTSHTCRLARFTVELQTRRDVLSFSRGERENPACGVGPERPDEGNLRAKAGI